MYPSIPFAHSCTCACTPPIKRPRVHASFAIPPFLGHLSSSSLGRLSKHTHHSPHQTPLLHTKTSARYRDLTTHTHDTPSTPPTNTSQPLCALTAPKPKTNNDCRGREKRHHAVCRPRSCRSDVSLPNHTPHDPVHDHDCASFTLTSWPCSRPCSRNMLQPHAHVQLTTTTRMPA